MATVAFAIWLFSTFRDAFYPDIMAVTTVIQILHVSFDVSHLGIVGLRRSLQLLDGSVMEGCCFLHIIHPCSYGVNFSPELRYGCSQSSFDVFCHKSQVLHVEGL